MDMPHPSVRDPVPGHTLVYERLTHLAARLLHTPIAQISLIDTGQQFVLSSVGLPEAWAGRRQIPLSHSFCQYVVIDRAPFVVRNALAHPRVAENRAVPDLGVIAYAGVPLTTVEGTIIGSLCVIDHVPRDWNADNLATLNDLATIITIEISREQTDRERIAAAQATQLADERAERQQATRILERITDAFIALDPTWRFTYVNAAAERLLRQSRDALLGQVLWEVFPEARGTDSDVHYHRAVAEQTAVVFTTYYLPLQTWFEVHAYPGSDGLTVYFRDISPRIAAEHAQRTLAEENERLYLAERAAREVAEQAAERTARRSGLTTALAEARTPADVAAVLATQGTAAVDAYAGVFLLRSTDGTTLELAAAVGYPPAVLAAWPTVPVQAPLPIAEAVRLAQPIWLPDRTSLVTCYPQLPLDPASPTQALASIPLVIAGQAVAVIGLSFDVPQSFHAEDQALILAMAEQCAQALDRANLLVAVQQELIERERTELALRQHQAFAESLLQAQSDLGEGVLVIEGDQIMYANAACTSISGYTQAELLALPSLLALLTPETRASYTAYRAALAEELAMLPPYETTIVDAHGREVAVELAALPVVAAGMTREVVLLREITARKAVEASLRLRDRAIAALRNGLVIADAEEPDQPLIYCNPAFTELTGYAADEALGRNCRFLQGPGTDHTSLDALRRSTRQGTSYRGTLRNYRKDGTPFWNDLTVAPVHDASGRLTHFVGILTDVSDQVRAVEALQVSEARFALAMAASPIALSIATLDEGRILDVNTGFVELTGYPREALLGQSVHELGIWVEPEARERLVGALTTTSVVRDMEIRLRTRQGEERVGLVAATSIDLHGERCLLAQIQDITTAKATETALRASEARFRSLAESAPDCIYVVDVAARDLIYSNRATFLGYPMAVLRQPNQLFATVHPDDQAALFLHWSTLTTANDSAVHVIEYRMQRADGAWEWLENRGAVLEQDDAGRPAQLMVSISVITPRKQAEVERQALDRALLETQKLESLGVLAGGIAHDFNNLLVAMLGNAELALLDLSHDHSAYGSVTQIQVACRRAAELTGQLLAYSGRGRFVVGLLDLSALVQEITVLLRASISRAIAVDYALGSNLPLVEGDATQLRQVVMNLVINAAEAIGDRHGLVRIRVLPRGVNAEDLAANLAGTDAVPGPYIALEVTDTGSGMDTATLGKLFEPFFTTKFAGRGLGMAAVQGIVRAHHGVIHITSVVDAGTTITILLPVATQQPLPPLQLPRVMPVTAAMPQQLVLVIDDEPEVRQVTVRMLERIGYQVVAAGGGNEGLALLEATPAIAAVLLDLTMPGLSGEATFQRLRQLRPELPIVIVSGYSEHEVRGRLALMGTVDVVQKPFTPATLREVLMRVL